MKPINILFMGTDMFSVPFLYDLEQSSKFKVVGVVTKTDKKVGRGGVNHQSITATHAQKLGVAVFKTGSLLKNPQALNSVDWGSIDYAVVVSFGFIIPDNILKMLPNRFINVHPSLLPKYRGPSPIQTALLNGDSFTGVSIMVLDSGMDTGPILKQKQVVINTRDTVVELSDKLISNSTGLLKNAIYDYHQGRIRPIPQPKANVVVCNKIKREDGYVTLLEKPQIIVNKYRAFYNWPGIYTKVSDIEVFFDIKTSIQDKNTIVKIKEILINVETVFDILKVQLPNKPVISFNDFINGYSIN